VRETGRRLAFLPIFVLLAGCGPLLAQPDQPAAGGLRAASLADDGDRIPPGYYKAAEGKAGRALLSALHEIVFDHTDLGYDRARDIMFDHISDPANQDTVAEIYTGNERRGIRDRRTAYERGLNTEHTWPQSLGASGAAKADLHHLRPSDTGINSNRSSYPYGEVSGKPFHEFPGVGGTSRMGNNRNGVLVFEPRKDVRGDIARGLFYFYTCYAAAPTILGEPSMRNFVHEAPVLAMWHRADPVNAAERQRNEAVYQAQGNRNPYIDRPEWLTAIGQVP